MRFLLTRSRNMRVMPAIARRGIPRVRAKLYFMFTVNPASREHCGQAAM